MVEIKQSKTFTIYVADEWYQIKAERFFRDADIIIFINSEEELVGMATIENVELIVNDDYEINNDG